MDRLAMYRDLQAVHELLSAETPSLQNVADTYAALQRYRYIESLPLTISDEVRLQRAVASKRRDLEQRLHAAIPSNPKLHAQLKTFDAFKDHFLQATAARSALGRLREELITLFSQEHYVADTHAALDRILTIVHTIPSYAEHEPALAAGTLRYVASASENLKRKLHNHLPYAHVQLESDLRASGKHHLEAAELTRIYQFDCMRLEHGLNEIITAASTQKLEKKQLLIGSRCNKSCDDLAKMLASYGEIIRFNLIPYVALATDEASAHALLASPKTLGANLHIHEPLIYTVSPKEAAYTSENWNLDLIRAPDAWRTSRGEGTKVAIIDTGIDYMHPDLKDRFSEKKGIDFVNDSNPRDDNGHGTHVAGTVAGSKTGVAPEAMLYAVKVLDMYGSGSEVTVLQGMEWAIEKRVDGFNMSLGSSYPSDSQAELLAIAAERGIVAACAAGNDGDSSYNYPASHDYAISVAAVNEQKSHAPFSNYNDKVDLCAPGVAVYSTWLGGGYKSLSGTSMATPHVAGGAMLLRLRGDKSPEQMLKETAEQLGSPEEYGAGLINLERAVQL